MNNPDPEKPGRNPIPQLPNRFNRSLMGWVVLIGMGLLLISFATSARDRRREITILDFWTYLEDGRITEDVVVSEQRIEGELAPDTGEGLKKGEPNKFYVVYSYKTDQKFQDRLSETLAKHPGPRVLYRDPSWWQGLLPQLLVVLVLIFAAWFLLFRRLGAVTGGAGGFLGSFGRSRHRVSSKEHTKVTFNEVAGIDEAKEEVREIIEFLRNPRRFQRLGGRIPRGVLLVGEPGCGKTLLAKAIAGEADVPFFSISGSDFVEMFVGVGASRVRDLFKQAKESAPCIIFLDEIDAVGRRRGLGFNGGGHDEREQTLNAILVEMDGFDTSDQVIVIAATNRMDVLDPALTRPGRFDRQIDVPLPDLQGRFQILQIYAGKVKCGPNVDLHRLARGTPMFSGADLAALVNEAAIAATMRDKEYIEQSDLEEARDEVRWGRARKSRVIDEREKEMTACHEAGHAMVQLLVPGADPLHKVSIIPRGAMGGATFSLPEKDRYLYTRSYCRALLCVCLGGRVAEKVLCNDISSGAAADIAQATEIARKMVLDWGMSDKLGLVNYAGQERRVALVDMGGKEYSESTAEVIDQEIKALIDQAYSTTEELVIANRDKLQSVARALLKYETLSGEEVQLVIDGKSLDKPSVGDLLDREQAKAPRQAPAVDEQPRTLPGDAGPTAIPEPG
jgi:cell division protease FtsH